ncbi:MAG TPA: ester cyclase [Bryobacteraceae bacterium]|jgi:steroid delta-isomerase-like uncharacterized protein
MSQVDRNFGERWFEEVWNKGRREAIAEMTAAEAVFHDGADLMRGPEGFYPFFDRMQASFSDLRVTVEDVIAEGDRLCVRWSCAATHTGEGLGIPPSRKRCQTTGISIVKVQDGKVIEAWQNWDMLGLLQQIQGGAKAATYLGA